METDNLNIIQNLIAEKEGGKVEFKQTTGQLERGMETLCAFLNDEGGTVGIAIYDDRVEIESSGAFPPDMTLEKLLGGHSSEPPNLIIANVLYKSELLESWGRGIRLMIDECRNANIPDPEFHTDGSSVWVVFRYELKTAGQVPDKHPTSTRQAPDKHRPAH